MAVGSPDRPRLSVLRSLRPLLKLTQSLRKISAPQASLPASQGWLSVRNSVRRKPVRGSSSASVNIQTILKKDEENKCQQEHHLTNYSSQVLTLVTLKANGTQQWLHIYMLRKTAFTSST